MVSILFLIGYLVIGIPVCLYAGAIAFEQIFDFATVFGISEGMVLTILIVLVVIIGALYAVLGGKMCIRDRCMAVTIIQSSGMWIRSIGKTMVCKTL